MERTYFDMDVEPDLNTPRMQEIQLAKLKALVTRLYENKPFWRGWMNKNGVSPADINSLSDFSNRIPVFDKGQRRRLFEESGGNMAEVVEKTIGGAAEDVVMIAATSGTTGEPTPYPLTRHDKAWFSRNLSRVLWRTGVRPDSRIIHAFGLSMFLAGVPYATMFQESGACVLPVGAEGGSEKILRFAELFKVDTLACTPSLAEHLIEKAPDLIGKPVGDLKIKRLICGGEPGAGIPEVRRRIEEAFGAKLYDTGAGFGISCDYPEYQGMHHVADDTIYFELVDPDTLAPVPFENGAKGMPVQTTLDGDGFLWFRETIGDICQVFTDPCPCGQSGFRYKVIGRSDDMLKIKGVIVYPAAIDGVVNGFAPRVTGEFRIILDEPPPRVVPPLKLRIEYGKGVCDADLAQLEAEIKATMHSKLKFTPQIEWLPPDTLQRYSHKTKFFEKSYEDQ